MAESAHLQSQTHVSDSGCTAGSRNTLPSSGAGAALLLVLRGILGSLFLFSGLIKIGVFEGWGDPQGFAGAVHAFRVFHDDLIPFAAYAIPWTEVICGGCLILGFGARGAAALTIIMLLAFVVGMVSVLYRHLDVTCSCFGGHLADKLTPLGLGFVADVLEAKIGPVSIIRNFVLVLIALPIFRWGPGMLALGRRFHII